MSEAYRAQRAPQRESRWIRGLGMHLTRWAGSGARTVLMLHGWLDCGESFQCVVDELPGEFTVVAPDWRGFGRSEWPQAGYWFADYLADLDALLDLVSPTEPVAIVGHSMGGHIASLYAGLRPRRVRSVVNIEGFGVAQTDPGQAPERLRTWLEQVKRPSAPREYPSFEQFAHAIRRRHPRIGAARAAFAARLWGSADPSGRVRQSSDPRHRRVNPVLYRQQETEACWRLIEAPALLLLGAESPHGRDGEDRAGAFQACVPHASRVSIASAGHMLHLEQPAAVARALAAFLAAH
ncbi:MAG TPA: alpha/beta hydrolase [Steroidobacteraceae bacterium]|nr:alpha/beta hydrolase [Steroidobacteraceae bacterium]